MLEEKLSAWGTTSRSFRCSKGLWVGDHFQVIKVSEGTFTVLRTYLHYGPNDGLGYGHWLCSVLGGWGASRHDFKLTL